jgi:hypothetical protein
MNRFSIALAAAAAAAALAGSANAGVTFFSFGNSAPALPTISTFGSYTVGAPPPAADGWSGTGVILNDTTGNGAEPATSLGHYGTGNYLSVEGGHSETLTFKPGPRFDDFNIYIGSLDNYNHLVFTLADNTTVTYNGTDLGAVSGADNGNQTAANTNGIFNFKFDQDVKSIQFSSDTNSFEIASIAAVPEPSTWTMMILGLGLMGATLRQRKAAPAVA